MARLAGKKEKKGKKGKEKKRGSIGGEKARAAGGEKVKGVTFWVAAVNSADTKFNNNTRNEGALSRSNGVETEIFK